MLSIIIPIYNEENIILNNHTDLIYELYKLHINDYEIIYWNDWSTDNSYGIINWIISSNSKVKIVSWGKNKGLWYNYQQLYKATKGDIIIQFWADFSTKADIIKSFILEISNWSDVVIASRYIGWLTKIPYMRKILSRIYNLVTRYFFHIRLYDSQSGFVAFKKEVIKSIILKSHKFDIHVELMYKIIQKWYKILEIPCVYIHRSEGSKFNIILDWFSTLLDTIVLYYKLVIKKDI